jgi:hypothetical protein
MYRQRIDEARLALIGLSPRFAAGAEAIRERLTSGAATSPS